MRNNVREHSRARGAYRNTASHENIAAVRNQALGPQLMAVLPKDRPREYARRPQRPNNDVCRYDSCRGVLHRQWAAASVPATTLRLREVRDVYPQMRDGRVEFHADEKFGRLSAFAAACFAFATLFAYGPAVHAQVVTPLVPPSSPPWSSLDVFEPVPFAQLWARSGDAPEPEDTPVKTRQQPGYESPGLRAGPWMFHPSLSGGVRYDNNVFASGSDKQGDLATTIKPSLEVNSLWERHGIDLQGSVASTNYRRFSQLDQTDANLRLRGRIDLWHDAAILTSFRTALLHEGVGSLTSPTNAAEPTPYTLNSAHVAYWQQSGRWAGSVGLRSDTYNFGSTRANSGSIINQDSRDGHIEAVHGRLDYALSGGLGLFTAVEGNRRSLRGTPTQSLDSAGYRGLAGVNLQLGNLVTGELSAGYASQRFDDPTIGTIEGPTYRALVNWSVTRLLDVHVKAEQLVTQAAETVAGGIRADAIQVGADYELRRNMIFSVGATYERDKFFGLSRSDDVFSTLTELTYKLNRYSTISLQHQYFRRESDAVSASYDKHEVGLNVTTRY
ncbi:MAG: outer membrane beta-barrel protein [Proteobacteria bacterium]|nr:outer membrane beta-barrel protein [Pseudomonadota bacterium]